MFSGIVQDCVKVLWVKKTSPQLTRYALSLSPSLISGLKIGASLSVHGVCQTVVSIHQNEVAFDAMAETLKCTTIGSIASNDWVNVERSLKIGDEIGGHLLSGHILGIGSIESLHAFSEQCVIRFRCNPLWMKYILPKGYIAINGASLTVVDVFPEGGFTVHLIPETLRITSFNRAKEGDKVNIEIDSQTQAIVDTVERVLANRYTHSR